MWQTLWQLLFHQGVGVFDKDCIDVAFIAGSYYFDTGNNFDGLSLRGSCGFFIGAVAIRMRMSDKYGWNSRCSVIAKPSSRRAVLPTLEWWAKHGRLKKHCAYTDQPASGSSRYRESGCVVRRSARLYRAMGSELWLILNNRSKKQQSTVATFDASLSPCTVSKPRAWRSYA